MITPGTLRPFAVRVPDAVFEDVRERLGRTRWPDEAPGANASFWPYYDRMHHGWPLPEGRIPVPTGYAEFPRAILRPPCAFFRPLRGA